jgi:putative endonuclease
LEFTSQLYFRIMEHKDKIYPSSFTSKYNCNKLVYFESFTNIEEAILREKLLKKWKREWKNQLIEKFNKEWIDLIDQVVDY